MKLIITKFKDGKTYYNIEDSLHSTALVSSIDRLVALYLMRIENDTNMLYMKKRPYLTKDIEIVNFNSIMDLAKYYPEAFI